MTAETRPKVWPRRAALKLYELWCEVNGAAVTEMQDAALEGLVSRLDQEVRAALKMYATPQLDGSRKAP